MRKAMIRSSISFDKSSNEQKPREQPANGKQKDKLAGTAKKNNTIDKIAQHSFALLPVREEVSDSYDEPQPEYGHVAINIKPQKKYASPRSTNPMLVGMTRHDVDRLKRPNESETSVD